MRFLLYLVGDGVAIVAGCGLLEPLRARLHIYLPLLLASVLLVGFGYAGRSMKPILAAYALSWVFFFHTQIDASHTVVCERMHTRADPDYAWLHISSAIGTYFFAQILALKLPFAAAVAVYAHEVLFLLHWANVKPACQPLAGPTTVLAHMIIAGFLFRHVYRAELRRKLAFLRKKRDSL